MNKQQYSEEIERIDKLKSELVKAAKLKRVSTILAEVGIQKGGTIKNSFNTIIISKLSCGFEYMNNEICLVARGAVLTKKGCPRRDKMQASIYIYSKDDFELIKVDK